MSGSFASLVYHERQGANRMCALHCLNTLLQSPIFSEYDLNKFAEEVDKQERMLLGKSTGEQSDYSSGYYSINVMERALLTKGMFEIVNVNRSDIRNTVLANEISINKEQGFIFNLRDHWFTVRQLHGYWFNLDSLKPNPLLMATSELLGFIKSTITQGYSVFCIRGNKPLPIPVRSSNNKASNQQLFTPMEIAKFTTGSNSLPAPIQSSLNYMARGEKLKETGTKAASDLGSQVLAVLGEEPSGEETCNFMVRMADGKRETRRFHLVANKLDDLYTWVLIISPNSKSLFRAGPPRKLIERGNSSLELAEFEKGQEMLIVQ
jgi:Ataxin-3